MKWSVWKVKFCGPKADGPNLGVGGRGASPLINGASFYIEGRRAGRRAQEMDPTAGPWDRGPAALRRARLPALTAVRGASGTGHAWRNAALSVPPSASPRARTPGPGGPSQGAPALTPRAVLRRGRAAWRPRAPATGPTTGRAHAGRCGHEVCEACGARARCGGGCAGATAAGPWGHAPRRRRADGSPKGRRAQGAGLGRRVGRHPVRASANFRGRDGRVSRPAAADVHASANASTVLPSSQTAYLRRDVSQHETVRHARRWVCMQTISRAGSARRSVTGLLALAAGSARAENQGAARRAASCQRGGPAIPIWSSSWKLRPARNFCSREARTGGGQRCR